jgi:hypothetical protein
MRTKRLVVGLKNSQKIRVILNGIGFITTVREVDSLPFAAQRIAIQAVLWSIGARGLQGLATRETVYETSPIRSISYDVQVDLL